VGGCRAPLSVILSAFSASTAPGRVIRGSEMERHRFVGKEDVLTRLTSMQRMQVLQLFQHSQRIG